MAQYGAKNASADGSDGMFNFEELFKNIIKNKFRWRNIEIIKNKNSLFEKYHM